MKNKKGLYIQMHSMHGLFRGKNLELGRDEDTGGQIVYVLELAKAFGRQPGVGRVDIMTRLIKDRHYPGYDKSVEKVPDNVRIIRIPCGGPKYIMKVDLWPHIDEFVENTIQFIEGLGRKPDILHSNYADAGLVCTKLSKKLGIPQVHTGHSLGKPKMERIGVTKHNYREMNSIFHFDERIRAEQTTFNNAKAIICSTEDERKKQYGMYDVDVQDGRFHVVYPGISVDRYHPFYSRRKPGHWEIMARERLREVIFQPLKDVKKPLIFSISRLDMRKNIDGLLKAYGRDRGLQKLANLVVFAGKRDNPEKLDAREKALLTQLFILIDAYDLQGKVSLPKHVDFQKEVPELYRLIARSGGVFVNPAYTEPFGITNLEAAASGLPVVSTDNGGPSSVITDGKNGILVDVRDTANIARGIKRLLRNKKLWKEISRAGHDNVAENYTWDVSARKELDIFKQILQ